MQNRYSLLFYLPLFLAAAVLMLSDSDAKKSAQQADYSINNVIGDESYISLFGEKPDKNTPEQLRIRTHLLYVENVLRQRPTNHLSPKQQKNRYRNLNLLRQYIETGEFPRNDGHPDPRRPTFIDEDGNICAVGYLVQQTAGHKVAEALNQRYKYAFISQIDDSVFNNWVKKSGLTKRELAMIQPTYGGHREEPEPEVETSYSIGSGLLATANILYLTNRDQAPWMFSSPKTSHWFGLTAGTASTLMGALNLDNKNKVSVVHCSMFGDCQDASYTQKRDWRTGVSVANIAIGLASITRSAYHLLKNDDNSSVIEDPSTTQFNITNIQTTSSLMNRSIPALKLQYNF